MDYAKSNIWTKEETDFLIKFVSDGLSNVEIGKLLNKTNIQINSKKRALKQTKPARHGKQWTQKEINLLLQKEPNISELANQFERSYHDCWHKRQKLLKQKEGKKGIFIWKNSDFRKLMELYGEKKSIKEISVILNIPEIKIRVKLRLYNDYIQERFGEEWTDEEIEILKNSPRGFNVKDFCYKYKRGVNEVNKFRSAVS